MVSKNAKEEKQMTYLRKVCTSLGRIIPAVALLVGSATASQACTWWFHQPKVPEGLTGINNSRL